MSTSKFCISLNFGPPVPSSWLQIKELMQSTQVKTICSQLSALPRGKEFDDLKRSLPAISCHACSFIGGKRNEESAIWNGMVCLEYDKLSEEKIEALRSCEPPTSYIKLAGKSCSGQGVWFLIEVPQSDYSQMEHTMRCVHESYCNQVMASHGLDIRDDVDIHLDLSRLRFLPSYDYIWWDFVEDFSSEEEQRAGYVSMYGDLIDLCSTFNNDIPEGQRHTTYKEYVVKAKKLTENKIVLLHHLPSLGLPETERQGLINWSESNIKTHAFSPSLSPVSVFSQPIDNEALPFPFKSAPKLIQTLVGNLPKQWQQSSAMCLLPALSVACGQLSQSNGKPLVFQVALYGLPQSGKTEFSAKPATIIMDYIGRSDNARRKQIDQAERTPMFHSENLQSPNILPFTDTSIVQMMKYLQYSNEQTLLAYEGDLSSALAGKDSTFLDIKKILRKGFDGETAIMDYKSEGSCKGSVKARLSALVIGTQGPIFNYFNAQSTAEGNSRRVILVEHEPIMKNITISPISEDDMSFIHSELDYLQSLPKQMVRHEKIEQAAFAWRAKKQQQANGDFILWSATQTPTEMFQRTAYLMFALNHFDEKSLKDCCTFGKWVAEYQYRSYINNTYTELQKEQKNWQQRKAPSTQKSQEEFNKKMFDSLPREFTRQDIIHYRQENNYPHDCYSQAIITRWKKQGLVASSDKKSWVKV